MQHRLTVGAAEIDITPPIGTGMVGSLVPRYAEGIQDPLYAKALVLEFAGTRLAMVTLDIATLPRRHGDACVQAAARCTRMAPDHIIWCAAHTHTGPISEPEVYPKAIRPADLAWLKKLPGQFAEAVKRADAARQPARMTRLSAFCEGVGGSRRISFKNGHDINRWNLARAPDGVQSRGYASRCDPEVGILCFDGPDNRPIAVLWNFACHANAYFGPRFGADYPAVTASRLRERFGPATISVYLPGASGDVNPLVRYRELGDRLAEVLLTALEGRQPQVQPVPLRAVKRDVSVPARPFRADEEKRRRASGWSPDMINWFRASEKLLRQRHQRIIPTVVQGWRIGDTGFVSLPGEPFVEWGLKLKAESPFPWTYPVELGGDYIGYLVTPEAEAAGGYESLNCWVNRTGLDGAVQLVTASLNVLEELWRPG